ncbi:RteC domain-containing protein [Alistipes senegalensis]|uniref:RteC domain-containing protein n=1 Tax=Alistipes senegalensis JC50 TaxID=1033732 RepID=A0ABY5V7K0_9BACT|nr:RteC domain-containing protein [Alistipes senegalensis]UEA87604.1 RteC domain-containing protein [Alistipes senegalensis]UWN64806.1 RteC domain-containing protein [Alistipes senegalensis JC50]
MKQFVASLEKEAEKRIKKIENSDLNILKKSLEASLVLGDAFQRLRDFITNYTFKSDAEEIEFFKVIKPRLYHRLIYYRKVYNIEMNRPVGVDSQKAYLIDEIKAINRYNNKHSDFTFYYRSGMTHLDSLYYLRNRNDTALYLESFHYERDPKFSTNADFKVAKLLANELLSTYLKGELEALEYVKTAPINPLPSVRLTWQDSKTDLTELIYLLDSKRSFGNVPLSQLAAYIANVFNIQLDTNLSRTFCDMKLRNNPTPWIDKAKQALLQRMRTWRPRNKNE